MSSSSNIAQATNVPTADSKTTYPPSTRVRTGPSNERRPLKRGSRPVYRRMAQIQAEITKELEGRVYENFTWEEVALHNTRDDCYIVLNGRDVHDITKFIMKHPGSPKILLRFAGKDATDAFKKIRHSQHAKTLTTRYKIGTIIDNHNERKENEKEEVEKEDQVKSKEESEESESLAAS